jgi:coenzyme F420-reducing hydrogenase beta subunit
MFLIPNLSSLHTRLRTNIKYLVVVDPCLIKALAKIRGLALVWNAEEAEYRVESVLT